MAETPHTPEDTLESLSIKDAVEKLVAKKDRLLNKIQSLEESIAAQLHPDIEEIGKAAEKIKELTVKIDIDWCALKLFRAEIRKAGDLLSFLMSEGHPYKIPDQTIENIECAQKFLDNYSFPEESDRTSFKKAYRDLITISQNSITYNGIPPKRFWQWKSPWPYALILFVLISAATYSFFSYFNFVYFKQNLGRVKLIGPLSTMAIIALGTPVLAGLIRRLLQINKSLKRKVVIRIGDKEIEVEQNSSVEHIEDALIKELLEKSDGRAQRF